MLCRVARTNAGLQRVLDAVVFAGGVVRTLRSLATQVPYRVLPLVRAAARSQAGTHPAPGPDRASRSVRRPPNLRLRCI